MNMTEAEMFKQMELGKIMAEDVLPKVAKEYSRVANENGALEKAQEKVNSQLQRFLNALIQVKREMFTGGFGQGMADSFKTMATFLNESREEFKLFGQVIGTAMVTVVTVLSAALSPLMLVLKVFNSLFGDRGAMILGTVGAVMGLVKAGAMLASAFAMANLGFMALVANIARYGVATTAFLITEDIYVQSRGGQGSSFAKKAVPYMQRVKDTGVGQEMARQNPLLAMALGFMGNYNPFGIEVKVNDSEFSKAIDVRVKGANEENLANTAASVGG